MTALGQPAARLSGGRLGRGAERRAATTGTGFTTCVCCCRVSGPETRLPPTRAVFISAKKASFQRACAALLHGDVAEVTARGAGRGGARS